MLGNTLIIRVPRNIYALGIHKSELGYLYGQKVRQPRKLSTIKIYLQMLSSRASSS